MSKSRFGSGKVSQNADGTYDHPEFGKLLAPPKEIQALIDSWSKDLSLRERAEIEYQINCLATEGGDKSYYNALKNNVPPSGGTFRKNPHMYFCLVTLGGTPNDYTERAAIVKSLLSFSEEFRIRTWELILRTRMRPNRFREDFLDVAKKGVDSFERNQILIDLVTQAEQNPGSVRKNYRQKRVASAPLLLEGSKGETPKVEMPNLLDKAEELRLKYAKTASAEDFAKSWLRDLDECVKLSDVSEEVRAKFLREQSILLKMTLENGFYLAQNFLIKDKKAALQKLSLLEVNDALDFFGVKRIKTLEEVVESSSWKKSYRAIVKVHHPDAKHELENPRLLAKTINFGRLLEKQAYLTT